MDGEVRFAVGLFRGTAAYYDRYRLPYPDVMIEDLARRSHVPGRGRLLDLACGTGQLAFALRRWFGEVWAVDAEPDMVDLVRRKAGDAGDVRAVVSSAETLTAEPEHFELAVVGNAFHRLDRDVAAGRLFGWLQAGGHLALCWSATPWTGGGPRSARRSGFPRAGSRCGSGGRTPRCSPRPGSSWPGSTNSPPGTD